MSERPGDPDIVRIARIAVRVRSPGLLELHGRHHALVRVDGAEALDDLEAAVGDLGDVHVHANMMLAGHHLGRAARAFGDPGMVERRDDVVLPQRAGLFHGGLPELHAAVEARARAAAGELFRAGKARVVLREQCLAERIADGLVVVEAAIQALDMRGRQQADEVLVEIRADDLSAAPREAGVVELLQERRDARAERSC